ncbi:hypothetical protein CY0110_17112 [Crocosphaera chwakensis CCY0110]|uniref:Uncharacterized protein n=1 Tax=Crocosphaera chwakensis CCY0110 TaxID=391612 RepID=A3IIA4_9CHRO|nr:hypothetical protein CY0110_17112 [Crocosphaera chwakensis CCY0110]
MHLKEKILDITKKRTINNEKFKTNSINYLIDSYVSWWQYCFKCLCTG